MQLKFFVGVFPVCTLSPPIWVNYRQFIGSVNVIPRPFDIVNHWSVNIWQLSHEEFKREQAIIHSLPKLIEPSQPVFDEAVFRVGGTLVDVNFHVDGWFCGVVNLRSEKMAVQVLVDFVNGDPSRHLVPIPGEIRLCYHRPQCSSKIGLQ
jgi:hypothetical protein